MRTKSWLLGCPEVASLVSRGFCCGTRAPGCMLRLCHYVPTPDKEYFVGMALPFEVASFARLCDCYQALLSRELLTQLASSSLLSSAPIPGLGRGCPAGWPCCWGTDCHPLLQGCFPAQGMQPPLLWHLQGWRRWYYQRCCDAALVSAMPGWGCSAPSPLGSFSVPCPGSIAITFPCSGVWPGAPLLLQASG